MISVIMPLYNNEKYVIEAIQSVINQTYKEWELLIINDASTDNSKNVVQKFLHQKKDNRIIFIDLKENKGVSFARNLGIKKSKGEYISFLDSDDFWDITFLKTLYTLLKKTNTSFACSSFSFFYNKNHKKPCISSKKLFNNLDSLFIQKKHRYELNYLYHISGIIVKKILLTKYNIKFPEDQTLFEDLLFLSKILCITTLSYCKNNLVYYRQHQNSVTHKEYLSSDYLQELIYLSRLKNFVIKYNKKIPILDMFITYRTYRVILCILKTGDISTTLYNIAKYEDTLKNFYHNHYFKLNERLKCKLFLFQNKFILRLLKYI